MAFPLEMLKMTAKLKKSSNFLENIKDNVYLCLVFLLPEAPRVKVGETYI